MASAGEDGDALVAALRAADDAMALARSGRVSRVVLDRAQTAVKTLARTIDAAEEAAEEMPTLQVRQVAINAAKTARIKRNEHAVELRKLVLRAARDPETARRELLEEAKARTAKDSTAKASSVEAAAAEVTNALARTRLVVEQELARSSATKVVLADSTKTLTATRDKHSSDVRDDLQKSDVTLTQLRRRALVDAWVFAAALLLFVLVLLYIMRRRVPNTTLATVTSKAAKASASVLRRTLELGAVIRARLQAAKPSEPRLVMPTADVAPGGMNIAVEQAHVGEL